MEQDPTVDGRIQQESPSNGCDFVYGHVRRDYESFPTKDHSNVDLAPPLLYPTKTQTAGHGNEGKLLSCSAQLLVPRSNQVDCCLYVVCTSTTQASADTKTGCLVFLEIQEGQIPMRFKKYVATVGNTAGTSVRLVEGVQFSGPAIMERVQAQHEGNMRSLICADSWFGSVKMVEAIQCLHQKPRTPTARDRRPYYLEVDKELGQNSNAPDVICAIKTNTGWFPHEQLQKEMEGYPSGAYLVMEYKAPGTNVDLVAIGYKYNSRKTLTFAMSKNAETTEPGYPYIARFPDEHGNVRERRVLRPKCLSVYFGVSNIIDIHNHFRQGILRLEMFWRTPNPWFRIVTTIIGCTVVDCYMATKFHLGRQFASSCGVERFADCLAWDLVNNKFSNQVNPQGTIRPNIVPNFTGDLNIAGANNGSITELMQQLLAQMGSAAVGPTTFPHTISLVSPAESLLTGSTSTSAAEDDASTSTAGAFSSWCLPTNQSTTPWTCPPVTEHRPIPNPEKSIENGKLRPIGRRCVICKINKTRFVCGHPSCMKQQKIRKKKGSEEMYTICGVAVCRENVLRDGMSSTCAQLHRLQIQQEEARQQNAN